MPKILKPKTNSQRLTTTLEWEEAEEVKQDVDHLLSILELPHIQSNRIYCYRSFGSSSRSYARIWSFPKIFQQALEVEPAYVIEVLAKYYDPLSDDEKKKVLIHELLHIPKNFSGALLPHQSRGRRMATLVNQLFKEYKAKRIGNSE